MKTILITGASGLIGSALTEHLLREGYRVRHMGRTLKGRTDVEEFTWDPGLGKIDERALENTDVIVHLAGTNVGGKRWTEQQKQAIINSRVQSTATLLKATERLQQKPQKIICASAMGYYGVRSSGQAFHENDPPGTDFMARVCVEWENAIAGFSQLSLPVLIFRIGVVLSAEGGALPVMAKPVRMYAGAPVGNGKQVVSWIHIDDLCRLFIRGIQEENFQGVYNAAAPHPVTNRELTQAIGKQLRKPVWKMRVPAFLLRMMLGEQADIVLEGVNVSADKLLSDGFSFRYSLIDEALADLLRKK